MQKESKQKWLGRNRPPRVQISYDVEIGDAVEKKELPLVVGVMAGLSGTPKEALPALALRRFIEIDRDNFNEVMARFAPRLEVGGLSRANKTGIPLSGELYFNKIDDFDPDNIVKAVYAPDPGKPTELTPCVPELYQLFETRNRSEEHTSELQSHS